MPAKGEKHIQVTPHGFLAHIRIHGELHRQHFPKDTTRVTIKQWLLRIEMRYRGGRRKRTGKFHDDAAVYLESVRAMPTFLQRKQHINEWVAVFGETRRDRITADEIRAQLHAWRTTPREVMQRAKPGETKTKTLILSAAAVNKRRTALMHLYTVLDGKSEPNPVRDVPKFAEPRPAPKALPMALVRAIFAAMPDSRSKARLMVLAFTGIPHAQIRTIRPDDVDLLAKTVAIQGRRKGQGTPGRIVPLTTDGVNAFKEMARADAWGTFSQATLRQSFQRGCTAAGLHGPDFTPYDLRHSFGTEVYRASGDIRATQILMDHSTPQLTHRYTLGAVDRRVAAAITAWEAKAPRKVPNSTKRRLLPGKRRSLSRR